MCFERTARSRSQYQTDDEPSVLVDVLGESRALGSLISHIVKSSSFTPPINKEELESITRSRGIQNRISCRAGVRNLFICLGVGDHPFCLIGARNFVCHFEVFSHALCFWSWMGLGSASLCFWAPSNTACCILNIAAL